MYLLWNNLVDSCWGIGKFCISLCWLGGNLYEIGIVWKLIGIWDRWKCLELILYDDVEGGMLEKFGIDWGIEFGWKLL